MPLLALGCGGGALKPRTIKVETFVANAEFPTQIRFAPDGRLFYSEKGSGRIRVVQNGTLLPAAFATLPVASDNEQGLLGLALDNDFANNGYVYAYYTEQGAVRARLVRFTAVGNSGQDMASIFDVPNVTNFHNGGRVGMGPDGKLYLTTGDHQGPALAQDPLSVSGKVHRLNADGAVPSDNPSAGSSVYTLGHRNPFGLAFHPTSGRPYISENGPDCDDEINLLIAGQNYGWRLNQPCNDSDPNFTQPASRFNPVIAPTGMTFYDGALFPAYQGKLLLASWNDGALRVLSIDDASGTVTNVEVVVSNLGGGLLDVAVGPDGAIYVAGRTAIYRLTPEAG